MPNDEISFDSYYLRPILHYKNALAFGTRLSEIITFAILHNVLKCLRININTVQIVETGIKQDLINYI